MLNNSEMVYFADAIHRNDDGYITIAVKSADGTWKQKHFDGTEKLLKGISKTYSTTRDIYMSVQSFYKPNRSSANIRRINAICIDLDNHMDGDSVTSPETLYTSLKNNLVDNDIIPCPSIAVHSGRGLHLYWLLDPLPIQGMLFWQAVSSAMAGSIGKWLKNNNSCYVVDAGISCDASRVMRLPGTVNQKSKTMCKLLYLNKSNVYRLDRLKKQYGYGVIEKKDKQYRKHKSTAGTVSVLLYNRIKDLETIQLLRYDDKKVDKCRRRMTFLYRHMLLQLGYTSDEAKYRTKTFNNNFKKPLSDNKVLKSTKSAEKAYTEGTIYKYKSSTLIELLQITKKEMKHLITLIDDITRYQRKKEKRRNRYRDEDGLTLKQRAMLIAREEISDYKEKGYTLNHIAKITGYSVSKVKRLSAERQLIDVVDSDVQDAQGIINNTDEKNLIGSKSKGAFNGLFLVPRMLSVDNSTQSDNLKNPISFLEKDKYLRELVEGGLFWEEIIDYGLIEDSLISMVIDEIFIE